MSQSSNEKEITRFYIGGDHAGYKEKNNIKTFLTNKYPHIKLIDMGCNDSKSCHYTDIAHKVCQEVIKDTTHYRGILLCTTGSGMSMVANRYPNIRCAYAHNVYQVNLSRQHNNANMIAIGTGILPISDIKLMLNTFIETKFDGLDNNGNVSRHSIRVNKIDSDFPKNIYNKYEDTTPNSIYLTEKEETSDKIIPKSHNKWENVYPVEIKIHNKPKQQNESSSDDNDTSDEDISIKEIDKDNNAKGVSEQIVIMENNNITDEDKRKPVQNVNLSIAKLKQLNLYETKSSVTYDTSDVDLDVDLDDGLDDDLDDIRLIPNSHLPKDINFSSHLKELEKEKQQLLSTIMKPKTNETKIETVKWSPTSNIKTMPDQHLQYPDMIDTTNTLLAVHDKYEINCKKICDIQCQIMKEIVTLRELVRLVNRDLAAEMANVFNPEDEHASENNTK